MSPEEGCTELLVTPRELAALVLLAESGLRRYRRDGGAPGRDTRAACVWLALSAPELAARCPWLLDAAGPEVAAAVRAAAATAAGVTAEAPGASQPPAWDADSIWTTGEVANMTGLSSHGVRAACRRGRLAAGKDAAGEWQVTLAAVQQWRGTRAA
jgi:hypothetical protein